MARMRRPVVEWPGILSPVSADYVCSHGTAPGIITIVCNEQPKPPAMFGDCFLNDGVTKLPIRDCKLHSITATTEGARQWRVALFDRRWRWQELGAISGVYNQMDPVGIYYPWNTRTPRDLVELCLRALGEREYRIDVEAQNFAAIPTNWDYQRPAQALQTLCDYLGCRVVYHVGSNRIWIVPAGKGQRFPNAGSIASDSPSLGIPERPDSIVCVGAPIRFQLKLRFEAVAKEWNGQYVPINDVSYIPTTVADTDYPWGGGPYQRVGPTARLSIEQAQALAQESVFRCYRLVNVSIDGKNGIEVPGYGRLNRREQCLFQETKVEQIPPNTARTVDGFELLLDEFGQPIKNLFYDGWSRDQPAMAYGSRFVGAIVNQGADILHALGVGTSVNTPISRRITVDFHINPELQVLTFAEPVFYFDETNQRYLPCEFLLECACLIRHNDNNQLIRYEQEYRFGGPQFGTPPLYVVHDDVVCNVLADYTEFDVDPQTRPRILGLFNGIRGFGSDLGYPIEETIARADYYLRGAAAKWQLSQSHMRTWNGLEPIFPDGAIQQVTWHVGEPKATTVASWNCEHSPFVPPYPARLRFQNLPSPMRNETAKEKPPSVVSSLPDVGWKGIR